MSALYSESTLAIGFPGEEQGVVLSCVEVEIKPVHYYEGKNRSPVLGFGEVEMKGFSPPTMRPPSSSSAKGSSIKTTKSMNGSKFASRVNGVRSPK